MALKNTYSKPVGVLGSGMFGTAVSILLSKNTNVIMYARKAENVEKVNNERKLHGYQIPKNVSATNDLEFIAKSCDILFPVVPSVNFRDLIIQLSPFLNPYHIMIHGTKGLNIDLPEGKTIDQVHKISRNRIKTMSEVIQEESVVLRIGCMAGPNLAKEILDNQPAATVIASQFEEVTQIGQILLRSDLFQVYESSQLIGVELTGVLKNIIAIAEGSLSGLGYGENAKALLISRGIIEMIHIGKLMGVGMEAFLGLAGIGDTVATCYSPFSRNYTVGFRLAKGETLEEIQNTMEETAEGINTVRIIKKFMQSINGRAPITESVYNVLYNNKTVEEALAFLMRAPFNEDINI